MNSCFAEYRIVGEIFNGFERWKVKQELKEMSTMWE